MDRRRLFAGIASIGIAVRVAAADAPDPAAAERQYRVARRLAAEGSPKAAEAFREALRLAPAGPLADDALVEEALLFGLPTFPDELGRLDADKARAAETLLRRVVTELPASDRAAEARFRAALLGIEAGGDLAQARVEMLTVAGIAGSPWSAPARYAVARIDEREGSDDRATAAYQRLSIDRPGTSEALRARAGIARILLRRGRYGEAAAWLQEAIDDGLPESTGASILRDLAVRGVRRAASPAWRWEAAVPETLVAEGFRNVQALVPGPGAGLLAVDRKGGAIVTLDPSGKPLDRVALEEPAAVAADPFGRVYAVAGDSVYRLGGGEAREIAALQRGYGASSLAVDDGGRIFVLDRKGEHLVRAVPDGEPVAIREFESVVTGIAWDGRRLVAVEERGGRLFAIDPDGPAASDATIASTGIKRSGSLSVDPSGAILVADPKAGEGVLVDASGNPIDRFRLSPETGKRLGAAAVTGAGTLAFVDASRGGLEVVR